VALQTPSDLREAAALWHERLRDGPSEDMRRGFEAWLEASPDHRPAYASIERTWAMLQKTAETPSILALRHETALRLTRQTSRRLRPVRALAAAVAVMALGMVAWGLLAPARLPDAFTAWMRDLWQGDSHYSTTTGERLSATLRDGSQITLDTQSELEVAFTKAERTVRLRHGQAFFEVAKDKTRPFVVEVNNRRFIAVGTAFDVRVDDDQIQVTMIEGVVRVEHAQPRAGSAAGGSPSTTPEMASEGRGGSGVAAPGSSVPSTPPQDARPPRAETFLSAGEQLIVDRQSEDRVRAADTERATSWRRGQLMFNSVRLGDAVAEVNRYSETKIELADPSLADVRISGSFATGRSEVFVEAVTTYFPIQVSASSERAVILKARR
jgi:transmembrane sensor